MEAKDLMIGDWVRIPHINKIGKVYRIDRANGKGNGFAAVIDGDFHESLLESIPLTKEILEYNGFELREGCTTAWDWHNGEQSVHISGDHTCPIGQTVTIYTPGGCAGAAFSSHRTLTDHKIRGVHELQHALRLCRINMEIKIKKED